MIIKVVGEETELIEFLRLLKTIQTLGTFGCSRDITVSVDGDGSGRLKFGLVEPDDEVVPLPLLYYEEWNEDEEQFLKLYIGE